MFLLSDDILICIIANWSDINCATKFDTACCSSAIRLQALELFEHDGFTMISPLITTGDTVHQFFKWITQRNIKLSSLCLLAPKTIDEQASFLPCPISLMKIKELRIDGDFDMKLENLINNCLNLRHLTLHSASVNDGLFDKIERLSLLESIKLSSDTTELTPKVLHVLADTCRNLQIIDLKFYSEWSTIDDVDIEKNLLLDFRDTLTTLLSHNNIKQLEIGLTLFSNMFRFVEHDDEYFIDSWGLVDIISNTCPSIEICKISYSGSLNTSHVANFFHNNKLLRNFTLDNNSVYDPFVCREIVFERTSEVRSILCSDFYDMEYDYEDYLGESRIECLFELCNSYTHIDLAYIHELGFRLLCFIAGKNFETLVHLSITECGTDWSISAIVVVLNACKQLTSLELKDCDHIPNIDFRKLYSTPNKLSILIITNAQYLETVTVTNFIAYKVVPLGSLFCDNCPLVDDDVLCWVQTPIGGKSAKDLD
jgi:hypothetical protein